MGFKTCFMICSKVFIKVFFVIKIDQIFFFMFELIMLFLYLVLYLNLEFLFINCFTNFIKFNLTDLHAPSLIQKLMHSSIQQLFFIINSKYHHQSINLILFQFHRNFHQFNFPHPPSHLLHSLHYHFPLMIIILNYLCLFFQQRILQDPFHSSNQKCYFEFFLLIILLINCHNYFYF